MREDQDYDVQAAEETELQRDPVHAEWEAREEGERDFENGIDILDGFRKLRAQTPPAAQRVIDAYCYGWSRGALYATAKEAGKSPWQELSAVV